MLTSPHHLLTDDTFLMTGCMLIHDTFPSYYGVRRVGYIWMLIHTWIISSRTHVSLHTHVHICTYTCTRALPSHTKHEWSRNNTDMIHFFFFFFFFFFFKEKKITSAKNICFSVMSHNKCSLAHPPVYHIPLHGKLSDWLTYCVSIRCLR